jgi:hypothetical protein
MSALDTLAQCAYHASDKPSSSKNILILQTYTYTIKPATSTASQPLTTASGGHSEGAAAAPSPSPRPHGQDAEGSGAGQNFDVESNDVHSFEVRGAACDAVLVVLFVTHVTL